MGTKFSEAYKDVKKPIITKIVGGTASNPIKCEECGKICKSIPGLTTHLLRSHRMDLTTYYLKHFTNLTPEFEFKKCSFCDNNAIPTISIDLDKHEISLSYDRGYACHSPKCVNDICIHYFGKPYAECVHQYEHIVDNMDYICKLYQKPIEEMRMFKYRPSNKPACQTSCSLEAFIFRDGVEEGTKHYNERNEKIRKSMYIEWYIEKYGLEEGTKKFTERMQKWRDSSLDIKQSKHQFEIFNALHNLDDNWQSERFVSNAVVDMVNFKKKLVIEYFGDYWHCNPIIYSSEFFNESLSLTRDEVNKRDILRLNKILLSGKIDNVIVVWENTFNKQGLAEILTIINNEINNLEGSKGDIVWI